MNPHQHHRTRTLCLIGALHAFTHVYTVALLPLYLQIQQDLKLSAVAHATLLVTILGLAYVLPSYPLGILADKYSRKRLLGMGLIINAVGFIGLAMSRSYATAVFFTIVAGLGGSFYHPSATALVARLYPEARGRALGLVGIGASAGFFLGPLYTGWRATAAGSWRAPVLELGLAGIVGALVFLWLAHEDAPPATQLSSSLAEAPRVPIFPSAAMWFFFLAATLILSFRDFAGQAMGTASSLFLQNAHGYAPKMAGMALSCVFIMSAISNPLFGHLSDKGRLRWATAVLACGAVLASVVPYLRSAYVIPAFLGYGFFFMASYPILEAALMDSVPDAVRGRVFGLFMTIGGVVGNFSHWAVGEWVGAMGNRSGSAASYNSMFAIIGAMIVASVAAFPFLHSLRKAEHMDKAAPASGANAG
jgi:MFS family permease